MGKLTTEKKKEILEVYSEMKSFKLVASKLGINAKTVAKHVRDASHDRNNDSENSSSFSSSNEKRIDSSQQAAPSMLPSTNFAEFLRRRERGDSIKQVILELGLSFEEAKKYETDYMAVNGFENFEDLYKKHNRHISQISRLVDHMVEAGLDPDGFVKQIGEVRTLGGKLAEMTTKLQNEQALFTDAFARRSKEETMLNQAKNELEILNVKISKARKDFLINSDNLSILMRKKDAMEKAIVELQASADSIAARF